MDKEKKSTIGKTVDAFEFIGSMASERSRVENEIDTTEKVQDCLEDIEQSLVAE